MPIIISYEDFTQISAWIKDYYSQGYYFSIEGTNWEPVLVTHLPLENNNESVERYLISDILKEQKRKPKGE